MPKELSQKSRRNIYVGAWILIVVQIMVLVGSTGGSQQRDPTIESFLRHPTSGNIGLTIAYLIGWNMLAIGAMIAGLTLWRHGNDEKSRIIIIASIIAIFVGSAFPFLPSSESAGANNYSSIVTTFPGSEFTVTFPHPVKKKTITAAGLESVAFESKEPESTACLRAEFMQGIDTTTIANNFRAILENYARLAGLSLPEITETEDRLGKVGTYSGTKKVGDFTIRVYGKIVLGESSAINCMVVEQLEVFPSEDTVSFLGSIRKK